MPTPEEIAAEKAAQEQKDAAEKLAAEQALLEDQKRKQAPKSLEEAMKALEEQQAKIHELNQESAQRRKALKAFEDAEAKRAAEEKKRREAEMSEAEKLKTLLAETAQARDALSAEMANLKLRSAVEREAIKQGFANPEDAYLLMDAAGVEVGDQGVSGVKEALEKLLKARPYLKAQPAPRMPNLNARDENNRQPDTASKLKELEQRFGLKRVPKQS